MHMYDLANNHHRKHHSLQTLQQSQSSIYIVHCVERRLQKFKHSINLTNMVKSYFPCQAESNSVLH